MFTSYYYVSDIICAHSTVLEFWGVFRLFVFWFNQSFYSTRIALLITQMTLYIAVQGPAEMFFVKVKVHVLINLVGNLDLH